jgi:hypothetical protein
MILKEVLYQSRERDQLRVLTIVKVHLEHLVARRVKNK